MMVTGSREWRDREVIREHLTVVHWEHPDALLMHGDARGADRLAAQVWWELGGDVQAYPANWHAGGRYNPQAGHIRNGLMVATMPDVLLAFFGPPPALNKGTTGAVKLALDAGIPVVPVGAVPRWLQLAVAGQEQP
jgi:hypothetical protein